MAVRTRATTRDAAGRSPVRVDRTLALEREDPSWVDARPFRAHLRHLMAAGSLDVAEVGVVLGLSTSAVSALLEGRAGRPTRRVSPETARRLLVVSSAEIRGLRWCVTPSALALAARDRLHAGGWSSAELATAVGFHLDDVEGLGDAPRCNRLLAVRLVGLARRAPGTIDDQDVATAPRAA